MVGSSCAFEQVEEIQAPDLFDEKLNVRLAKYNINLICTFVTDANFGSDFAERGKKKKSVFVYM